MRVVVDTNVLVAGLVAEGVCRDIVKRRLPALLQIYQDSATVLKPKSLRKPVCRDPDDDELLAIALAGKAEIILTGDKDLLTLKQFQGIKILSPRQFVEWMDRQK